MRKTLVVIMIAAVLAGGCAKKPQTNAEVKTDVISKLEEAGIEYLTIQMSDGKATLDMRYTGISDLSPLAGMPIESISLAGNPVTDLTPLSGLPLTILDVSETKVSDISPLKGLQLTSLNLAKTKVSDLSALQGMPLEWLSVNKCEGVSSVAPLKGMPLKSLNISFTAVTDVSPLQGMELESIWFLPSKVKSGRSVLKSMTTLQKIGTDSYLTMPAENFWQKYGG